MARYTEAEKADAVAHYLQHGLAATHQATGVPKPTLHDWVRKAGHDTAAISERSADQTRAATEQHIVRMQARRVQLQAQFADSALFAAGRIDSAKDGRDAQGWATASAILTDKLRLELGEATARTEVVAPERRPEHDEEIAILYDLTERRAG
jgi:transposase-like protein